MADEIRVNMSLQIVKDGLNYQSLPSAFTDNMDGTAMGPVPGAITVPTTGKIVDFSPLGTPGWLIMINLDPTNFVRWGIWDEEIRTFYPIGRIKPKKIACFMLDAWFELERGTGTGSGGSAAMKMYADTASCKVFVGGFEA